MHVYLKFVYQIKAVFERMTIHCKFWWGDWFITISSNETFQIDLHVMFVIKCADNFYV